MMTTSCPGFLDRYGVWNNGFDCSSPRVCCGSETDRYCCISSTLPSHHPLTSSQSSDDFIFSSSNNILSEKWFLLQICIIGIFLAISLLIFILICQCLTSIYRNRKRQQQTMSITQIPLPAASPLLIEHNRLNRISTISRTPSDIKSRCINTTSMVLNTPLNIYPTTNSRGSTSTSSSYYMFPNEFEQLCK